MEKFFDYEILEQLDETGKALVYRGKNTGDHDNTVIIKILKTRYSTVSEIARFKQEYNIIKNLHIDGILETYDIIEDNNVVALILEDFDAISLKDFIQHRKIDIKQFLELGVCISGILGNLHKNNIIHKDIKPHNILINSQTGEIKISDFGIATELTRESEEIYNRVVIEGTLAYMSPEQTGRMNRAVDYRTDLYSLGISFYEILLGSVPFPSKDSLEIIHQHIAGSPLAPAEVDPSIPEILSAIIMKLLSKTAEERYQNGFGLMADLKKCREDLEQKGTIEYFELGKNDISLKFNLPQHLFGRDEDIDLLMEAFENINSGGSELMLVSGEPGIGKSVLIKEIDRPVVANKGYFISGKFEQYGRDVPYSAIIQALRGLVRHILSESWERIDSRKRSILKALGSGGKVVTDVIPEVELIIGKQPEVPELNPEEAQNRFTLIFKNFIKVFAVKEQPLVLFLDDLQWADRGSLYLMEEMIIDPQMESLLLLGAYRDTEVAETHPLSVVLEEIGKKEVIINEIVLGPLNVDHVNGFVSEVLRCNKERSFPLAELVHKKTGGNPFFVKQFMKSLYDTSLLEIDPAAGWYWDIGKIEKVDITGNVVDLMTKKIRGLEENSRELLKIAACLGDRFHLVTISAIVDKPVVEALENLAEPVQEGLVGMSGDIYTFQHDRIREAAYSLIDPEKKKELHLYIGRLLLEKAGRENTEDEIFYIANHLNYGKELLTTQTERYDLARLNLEAGQRAKRSTAFDSAYEFLYEGLELVNTHAAEDPWETDYELALNLYTESGECAYLAAKHEEADEHMNRVLEKAKSPLDKTRVYEVKIMVHVTRNEMVGALDLGKEALSLLGFPMPKKATRLIILKELFSVKMRLFILKLKGKDIKDLLSHKESVDPHKLASSRILIHCTTAAYVGVPDYLPIVIFKLLNLSLRYGNSPNAAFAYAAYGLFVTGAPEDIDLGYEFGELALKLVEKYDAKDFVPKINHIFGCFINHWKNDVRSNIDYLMKSYNSGPDAGDITFSLYSLNHYVYHSIFFGGHLSEEKKKFITYFEAVKTSRQTDVILYYRLYYQILLDLNDEHKKGENLFLIQGDFFREEEIVPYWIEVDQINGVGSYIVCKLFLYCLYGVFETAVETAREIEKYPGSILGMVFIPMHNFYYSLAMLACCHEVNPGTRRKYLKQVKANQKKMKKWVHYAPVNQLHRYQLIEAEIAALTGDKKEDAAMDLFRKAIEEAGKNGFTVEEGIANERAASFFSNRGYNEIANMYISNAYACYTRWGAIPKINQLEEQYPWLEPSSKNKRSSGTQTGTKGISSFDGSLASTSTSSGTISEALDLSTVIKASQALSGEIVLSKLLSRLMRLSIENAGAEKGYMILERNGKLLVEAEGAVGTEEIAVLKAVPLEEH
ncbi:MAG: serine/threonine-protein kinase PknK, partial [bacterium]|nr:serine/threonine-protein kinase PknK [bacterium]